MSERVREITFEHFRGLPDYTCELKGKSIVVLSGNGKGKSGIVDGVEFLFSGTIARFHGEGTGSINAEEAIQHVHKKGKPAVELHFTPTNDKVRRALTSEIEIPSRPTIANYIATHPPAESFILRRAHILDFICDQDADRYRKYIQLLGLTELDRAQRAFVEASQQADNELIGSRQTLTGELALFREPGWTPASLNAVLAHCSQSAISLGLQELRTWGELDTALATLEARRSPDVTAQVDCLNKGILSFERQLPVGLAALVATANETQNALARLKAASEEAAAGGIIREGISFFHAHTDAEECPLCEKPLDEGYSEILERLKRRSDALIQLRENEERISNVLDQLLTKFQQSADQVATDLENRELLVPEDITALRDGRASFLRCLRTVKRIRRHGASVEIVIPDRLRAVSALRARVITDLMARRAALIPADSAELENGIALLRKAQASRTIINQAEGSVAERKRKCEAAIQARDAFSTAREKAIQRVFDQIAGKVLKYYKKLHEGGSDASECTEINLKATPRAAAGGLRLAIQFLGLADLSDPRAFLSEGHLDSLGLCLYLATVRMFNPAGSLLVLDDVLTSVDKEHRHRVAELLFEEFADYQMVLTTHDEHWFGILQSKAQARGDQGSWVFTRITRWTLDGGPESAAFENTWAYIEANLTEEAYRELGGPLRLVLEDFLKRVAAKIDLRVRYNFEGRYTSADFVFAGIQNEVRNRLIYKTPSDEADIKRDLGRVFGTGDLINFLSHDTSGRLEVTFTQTLDFVSALKALTKRCQVNQLMKGIGA